MSPIIFKSCLTALGSRSITNSYPNLKSSVWQKNVAVITCCTLLFDIVFGWPIVCLSSVDKIWLRKKSFEKLLIFGQKIHSVMAGGWTMCLHSGWAKKGHFTGLASNTWTLVTNNSPEIVFGESSRFRFWKKNEKKN